MLPGERPLDARSTTADITVDLPPDWKKTFWGGPMLDVVSIIRSHRDAHTSPPDQEANDADRA